MWGERGGGERGYGEGEEEKGGDLLGFLPLRRESPPKPEGGMGALLVLDEFRAFHSVFWESTSGHIMSCIP